MPRRVEDMVMSDKRSIRNVSVDKPLKRARPERVSEPEGEEVPIHRMKVTPPSIPKPPSRKKKSQRNKKIGLVIIVAVVLLVAGTALIASAFFSRASFTVVPVTLPVSVNNVTIVASGTSSPGYLRYEVIKYSGAASTTLPAADGANISTKSAGTVTLYNAFSDQVQRLIAGTRLSNENGLIYRLTSSVVVPGYSAKNSAVPGTVKASIVADEAGAQYNMIKNDGGSEFKIAAYAGTAKYASIYAKSFSGMTGGFVGTKKTVNPALLASTTKDIQNALSASLRARAMAGVPDGYVTYDNAYTTTFAPVQVGGNAAHAAIATVSGTLYSIVFRQTELAAKLAGNQSMDRFGKAAYSIAGLQSLKFVITNPSSFSPAKANPLIARLNGDIKITGVIPVAELRHKLAGISLSATRTVLASYSSVIDLTKSSGELFPSWAGAVPKDESRISVVVGQ